MKKIIKTRNVIGSLFTLSILLFACKDKSISKTTYTANVPIYMAYDKLRSSVTADAAKELTEPGKIFYKGSYIFISDYLKGVHIIDNTNPSAPQNIAYVSVPGNVDIAVKGNTLYADSYTDLVAIDLTDMNNIHEISRSTFAFDQQLPPYDERYMISEMDPSKGVIIGWKLETITRIDDGSGMGEPVMGWKTDKNNELIIEGKAGSMSRFAMKNNYLYATNQWSMKIFDISNPSSLTESPGIYLNRNAETIFHSENKLFIGTQTGLEIYDVTNDATPTYVGSLDHGRACDPVAIEGNKAYYTLRAGGRCGEINNELHVADITNLSTPTLDKAYSMQEPYGLAIENGTLYVCDGSAGVKIYNASNPLAIDQNQLSHITDYSSYDIILYSDYMMVVGPAGLYQYNRSNPGQPIHLSTIPVL